MKIDFHKSHKELLALMKKMKLTIITADDYKAFAERQGKDDALTFEDITFENGATPILIERNGNSITVYDSDGKYRYFKSIARDIVKRLYELIAVYKPYEERLTKFEYNVTFSNGFPIKVSVDALDKDDANEKLYAKLSSISEETPSVVELVR